MTTVKYCTVPQYNSLLLGVTLYDCFFFLLQLRRNNANKFHCLTAMSYTRLTDIRWTDYEQKILPTTTTNLLEAKQPYVASSKLVAVVDKICCWWSLELIMSSTTLQITLVVNSQTYYKHSVVILHVTPLKSGSTKRSECKTSPQIAGRCTTRWRTIVSV